MGICDSSKNNNNEEAINNAGPGLPPQNIIPQPVEVSNLPSDLNAQITNTDNPIDNLNKVENVENNVVNSINSKMEPEPITQAGKQSLNISNSNVDNSKPNEVLNNTNLGNDLSQTKGGMEPLDNDQNLGNTQTQGQLQGQVIDNSQFANSQRLGNTLTVGQTQAQAMYQSQYDQKLENKVEREYQRVYLVVQLPQREIEITKLYGYHSLMDIEPYIAPDKCDEYDFYDSRGYSIDDYLYTPFVEWHNIAKTLRIKLIRSGLNIAHDIRKYISRRTFLIGCLTFDKPNSFGLFIFDKMNNSTLSFEYSTNIYLQMKKVNQFSSYCNALNKLYISGGELSNNEVTDSFICIDLNEVQQNIFVPTQLCNLQKRRYWHSMIFIPEKYIFIVGGPNETDVELYDIDKNISKIDSKLNIERCEPSLILVNNKFLYAIFGFQLYESFINTIERCNINRRKREWEMVDYKLNNTPNLVKAFFGVSYVSNNILLVSDKESENDLKSNYVLYPGRANIDSISDEGILNSRSSRLFAEKFFIPFTEKESINLAFKSGEPKIFIVNNENGAINELCLTES